MKVTTIKVIRFGEKLTRINVDGKTLGRFSRERGEEFAQILRDRDYLFAYGGTVRGYERAKKNLASTAVHIVRGAFDGKAICGTAVRTLAESRIQLGFATTKTCERCKAKVEEDKS